jgi:acetyl-CoA carboxylase biotin carboxyl carrier protein
VNARAANAGTADDPDIAIVGVLDALRAIAAQLLTGVPHPPSALRLRAGEVTVELEWAPSQAVPAGNGHHPLNSHAAVPVPSLASPAAAVSAATAGAVPAGELIVAPTVGVFYRAPEPGAEPFVGEGDQVVAGQQVAIVEAMKLMIPVEAASTGRIVEILQADGAAVEFGQPLFRVDPAAG